MTERQFETLLGTKFNGTPMTDVQMNDASNRYPVGTLVAISAENTSFSGNLPPKGTPLTDVPGHFFWRVKSSGPFEYYDGQSGGKTPAMPPNGAWIFGYAILGNPLHPG